jgi:hypothetical protein
MDAMTKVDLPTGGEPKLPANVCCNCGCTAGLRRTETKLIVTRFMLLGGTEWTFKMNLPHCEKCGMSLKRIAPTFGKFFWVTFLWTWVVFLLGLFLFASLEWPVPGGGWAAFVTSVIVAAGAMFVWYVRRKPEGSQTSFYQPVRILKLRQKFFSGETTGMVLGFTNSTFSKKFLEANPTAKTL